MLIPLARPQDRVTYLTADGKRRTAPVVMAFPTHLVCNVGGPHGTPQVVVEHTIVSIRRGGTLIGSKG